MKKMKSFLIAALAASLVPGLCACGESQSGSTPWGYNSSNTFPPTTTAAPAKPGGATITQAAPSSYISYMPYDNGLFSAEVPYGWEVRVLETSDYIHYTFQIYNPDDPNVRLYFNMKTEGYIYSKADWEAYNKLYPDSIFAKLPYLEPQTTEQFCKIFSTAMKPNNTARFTFPSINNFTKVQSLSTDPVAGETIRGTYTDENGNTVEGAFTCAIYPVYMYATYLCNVYHTIFLTAPQNEIDDYLPVLLHIMDSIAFSDEYIRQYQAEEGYYADAAAQISALCTQMTDTIIANWEERVSQW